MASLCSPPLTRGEAPRGQRHGLIKSLIDKRNITSKIEGIPDIPGATLESSQPGSWRPDRLPTDAIQAAPIAGRLTWIPRHDRVTDWLKTRMDRASATDLRSDAGGRRGARRAADGGGAVGGGVAAACGAGGLSLYLSPHHKRYLSTTTIGFKKTQKNPGGFFWKPRNNRIGFFWKPRNNLVGYHDGPRSGRVGGYKGSLGRLLKNAKVPCGLRIAYLHFAAGFSSAPSGSWFNGRSQGLGTPLVIDGLT